MLISTKLASEKYEEHYVFNSTSTLVSESEFCDYEIIDRAIKRISVEMATLLLLNQLLSLSLSQLKHA
jgi:hypothetical protein